MQADRVKMLLLLFLYPKMRDGCAELFVAKMLPEIYSLDKHQFFLPVVSNYAYNSNLLFSRLIATVKRYSVVVKIDVHEKRVTGWKPQLRTTAVRQVCAICMDQRLLFTVIIPGVGSSNTQLT